jgi:hypothetical protein
MCDVDVWWAGGVAGGCGAVWLCNMHMRNGTYAVLNIDDILQDKNSS